MTCILCKKPRLLFCEYESEYCIFHYSEEIEMKCILCNTIKLCKRNKCKCQDCLFTSKRKYPIIIKTFIFHPK